MPAVTATLAATIALAAGPASPRDAQLVEIEAPAGGAAPAAPAPDAGGSMPETEELPARGDPPSAAQGPLVFDLEGAAAPASGAEAPESSEKKLEKTPATTPATTLATTPPMPEIEELPAREGPVSGAAPKIVFGGAKDREPIGGGGPGFFDPGKLDDAGPGGGVVQIRGYVGINFTVAERTDTTARDPATGQFERLETLPYFGGGAANLFVGAPIYADVVYARVAFEFLMIPRSEPGSADVAPPSEPYPIMESAALEVNPFFWAEKAPAWFRQGFKITGGVFVLPFGLEDERHDAPVRWFVSRPLAMSTGRVYPGSWIDAGIALKWKPSFSKSRVSPRALELDVGLVNGDACTQTRATDLLYRYRPVGQVDEVCERRLRAGEVARGDGSVLGITPDNNGNKSLFARLQVYPVPALNVGGSLVWGTHPPSVLTVPDFNGMTFVDADQAPTWRVGGHLDLILDEAIQSPYPLPHLRGEFVYGVDHAIPAAEGTDPTLADRRMIGGYAQIAQPLWRRKQTRLPGLIVQYRFDYADPDLDLPRVDASGAAVEVDFADSHLYDEAMQGHIFGLRFPVLPRFQLKAEYGWLLEEGGDRNRVFNNFFSLQAVADF